MHVIYHITGQSQNRINQLMHKHSPKHTLVIWVASLACLLVPFLTFRDSLSNILLSGLFGSAFITFWILNLGLKYAVHKRFSLHYQPDLDLETRTMSLEEDGIKISSSLLESAFRPYKQVKMITVEDGIIVIVGKNGWIEMIPCNQITEGNCGLLLDILCQRTGKNIKSSS